MANGLFVAPLVLTYVLARVVSGAGIRISYDAHSLAVAAATPQVNDPVLVGAGDVASCDDLAGAKATAQLIENIPGTVFVAGDLAYPDGSDENFANCYGPTWGRFKDRTRPAPGNHEYHHGTAYGYAHYFGAAAGDPQKGYYSYDLGSWHILSLNSEWLLSVDVTWRLRRDNGCSRILRNTRALVRWLTFTNPCSVLASLTEMIRK